MNSEHAFELWFSSTSLILFRPKILPELISAKPLVFLSINPFTFTLKNLTPNLLVNLQGDYRTSSWEHELSKIWVSNSVHSFGSLAQANSLVLNWPKTCSLVSFQELGTLFCDFTLRVFRRWRTGVKEVSDLTTNPGWPIPIPSMLLTKKIPSKAHILLMLTFPLLSRTIFYFPPRGGNSYLITSASFKFSALLQK